jgi:hypothetical protein
MSTKDIYLHKSGLQQVDHTPIWLASVFINNIIGGFYE